MELDDLKQAWQQAPIKKNTTTDIMELIQHKSYGPVAAMKKGFKKEMMMMSAIPLILLLTNLDNISGVFRSVMFWSYVAFCIGMVAFAAYSYGIVARMGSMDVMVKSGLEQQIQILEQRLRQTIIGIRIAMLYFIVLTEIMPYFQHYRSLELWHSVPAVVRYTAYAILLVLQYFVSRRTSRQKFGAHLDYLKGLAKEM